jgi:hypothetical protein
MEIWIPLIQSLIWPIFIAVLLFLFRSWFKQFLEAVKNRIESGSEMSVGPGGFVLGSAPRLDEQENSEIEHVDTAITKHIKTTVSQPLETTDFELAKYFRLLHFATHNPKVSQKRGKPYYTIKVWLDADNPELLDKVARVVYHLHPTFPNPEREISTSNNHFELKTYGWGQFNLTADVYFKEGDFKEGDFKEGDQPLKLSRYINF